ncbi:MAG: GNAT family N-acetyltransferase [Hoeflea sp.]|uniref:GNAT family N-acetyltransferase n=1 Tax=Hoeflea sp. TaxID=1940281 RepID=UPI003EFABD14
MIEIRPARPEDHAEIVEILHQGWHDAHAHLVAVEILKYRTSHYIDDLYRTSTDMFHVADEGRILGFVVVNGAELTKLFVARDVRGSGIAEKLLAYGEEKIAAGGFAVGELLCLAGNERAERFYTRAGWIEDHRRHYSLWMPRGAPGHFTARTMSLQKILMHGR